MTPEATQLLQWLDRIGAFGLAFIVYALMAGRLITRREFDSICERLRKTEERLDKALDYGDRALGAGEVIRDKLPAKR